MLSREFCQKSVSVNFCNFHTMFHYNWFHVKFYSNFTDTENATTEVTEKDVESFENLFAKLVNFKETAAGLPDEERKKFAEQVALSFYSALGEESEEDWF